MIIRAIENCIQHAQRKNWDVTFWAFDIHSTILVPNYTANNIPTEFYPKALETLKMISKMKAVCPILYTCSHPHEIDQYQEYFKNLGIEFKHVNCNPDVSDGAYGYYQSKFYFNVLFEDKAGFDPSEWYDVHNYIVKYYDFEKDEWKTTLSLWTQITSAIASSITKMRFLTRIFKTA